MDQQTRGQRQTRVRDRGTDTDDDGGERLVLATVPRDHGAHADPTDDVGGEDGRDRREPGARIGDVSRVAQQPEHRERGDALEREQREIEDHFACRAQLRHQHDRLADRPRQHQDER